MSKGLIRLCYAKVIDAAAQSPWDKVVFEETYQEFYMQAQLFDPNGRHQTFRELLTNVPQAEQLHYLTSRVAVGYLKQLNQLIPDVVNVSGKPFLPFTEFRFEILASHVQRREDHQIAIYFYSDPLTWIDTIADRLLIATGDQRATLNEGGDVPTELIALPPNLSIWSYRA